MITVYVFYSKLSVIGFSYDLVARFGYGLALSMSVDFYLSRQRGQILSRTVNSRCVA